MHRGHREVAKYPDERIDLVFPAHRADFEKREAGVHREHQDGAEQYEKRVAAGFERLHSPLG
jgi:hypothetical protein